MRIEENVSFDFIRYANCWEDADLLSMALDIKSGEKVLSICSGGDNSFALLLHAPEKVVAVDINPTQLYLAELKKNIIKNYDHAESIAFMGYSNCQQRIKMYTSIKNQCSTPCQKYWDSHLELIEKGIIHQGKFEKYLRVFAYKILPLIHTKSTTEKLFSPKSEKKQIEFYQKVWNSMLWKGLFKLFFSRKIMGILGRDPAFLKEVKFKVSDYIKKTADDHLKTTHSQTNPFLHYCLLGDFGGYLPLYLRKENFEKVKNKLHHLILYQGNVQQAFLEYGTFDKLNLSNIFEYMDEATFRNNIIEIVKNTSSEGRIAFWNLMVEREINLDCLESLNTEHALLRQKDKGFFYKKFLTYKKL